MATAADSGMSKLRTWEAFPLSSKYNVSSSEHSSQSLFCAQESHIWGVCEEWDSNVTGCELFSYKCNLQFSRSWYAAWLVNKQPGSLPIPTAHTGLVHYPACRSQPFSCCSGENGLNCPCTCRDFNSVLECLCAPFTVDMLDIMLLSLFLLLLLLAAGEVFLFVDSQLLVASPVTPQVWHGDHLGQSDAINTWEPSSLSMVGTQKVADGLESPPEPWRTERIAGPSNG